MANHTNPFVQPFVKWVGGKRQLLTEIQNAMPPKKSYSTYYEPFVGGGAVLFHNQPKKAVINDYNADLINAYEVIKNNVDELIDSLKKHENTEDYFYKQRELDRQPDFNLLTEVEKASRLIYLNKTCFNGLYRVNSQGFFNTPYGRYKNPNIVNEHVLRALNTYFSKNNIIFRNGDFEDAVKNIRKGAFVYFDPPYAPISTTSNYTGYTLAGFNEADQIRLKKLCDKLDKQGVKWLLSNSKVDFITELYKDYDIQIVNAKRNVNSVASKRGEVEEVLIKNY